MLDTIADIRSRLGTCRQRDADTATLLGIVDTYVEQLKAVRARANKAERTLESLTPGGGRFHGSPENCAAWVRDQRKTFYSALCRTMDERNQSQGAMARMRGALEEIMARCEMRMMEDDAHYENYYEAKEALSTPPDVGWIAH